MKSIFQHHPDGLEGYRHRNHATFLSFLEIQHLPVAFCGVSDGLKDYV